MNIHETMHQATVRLTQRVSRFRYVMSVLLLLLISSLLSISWASNISTHYIIAFDQSLDSNHSDYLSPKTMKILDSVLKEADFNYKKDFLSIVGYAIEMGAPSMERFVRPYVATDGDTIIWKSLSETNISSLFKKWPEGQPLLNPSGLPTASLQSLAKPYIVMETKKKDATDGQNFADRTILLLVSDEKVNGPDDNYSQEWDKVKENPRADSKKFSNLEKSVFNKLQGFNEEFKFVQVGVGKNHKKTFPISLDGKYKVTPYEVVATDKPSIHSVTDFPSPLPLKRVRGGFKMVVKSNSITKKYGINEIRIRDQKGKILGSSSDGDMNFILSSKDIQNGDTLIVSLSLILKDGYYNGALIGENNPRYKEGMITKQVVRIQDEAKVLGLMPLSDTFWWWFPDDVFTAVMIWDLIILLIIIIAVGYILYKCFVRINTYKPSNDKIKITKV